MIDALFSQTNYVTSKKLLDATALRFDAIASNLANVDSPKYRRLDVQPEFSAELRQAVASRNASRISALQPSLAPDPAALASQRDGNNVDVEKEMLHLTENSLEHTLHTQMISGSLLRLRLAISGRP